MPTVSRHFAAVSCLYAKVLQLFESFADILNFCYENKLNGFFRSKQLCMQFFSPLFFQSTSRALISIFHEIGEALFVSLTYDLSIIFDDDH